MNKAELAGLLKSYEARKRKMEEQAARAPPAQNHESGTHDEL